MTAELGNGTAITRLLGQDGMRVVGILYLWESGDLGIFWIGDEREISFLEDALDADILKRARSAGSLALADFLETLPVKSS